jgi:hypothetical protein
MDLLKNGVIGYLDTMISQMLVEYGVELNEGAIASVNNLVETYPKYVVVDDVEYDVDVNKIYSGTSKARLENERDYIQLDIFNYKDFNKTDNKYKVFQINNCYNNLDIPKLDENKLISFYRSLVEKKDFVFLPKYKEHNNYNYKD